ncbi:MAG: DUF6379 domain-containing protein [Novosphingobium sp.]|nr:DUF6379 domain-containing protein [Novosphingobium sp.]
MFDKYIIDPATLRNTGPDEAPDGFAFETRLGYYRGLTLSMVEELNVGIDGEPVARADVSFDDGAGALTLDQMETAYDRRWAFGAPATILVRRAGGFPKGDHTLTLQQKLRISYMPFPSFNNDEKRISFG